MVSCTCNTCKAMCHAPCLPTPKEAQDIIDAGYSDRLQFLRWWLGMSQDFIAILRPASAGHEKTMVEEYEHFTVKTSCTFQDEAGLCQLHDCGLKPGEGREAICTDSEETFKESRSKYVETWSNKEARDMADKWRNSKDIV